MNPYFSRRSYALTALTAVASLACSAAASAADGVLQRPTAAHPTAEQPILVPAPGRTPAPVITPAPVLIPVPVATPAPTAPAPATPAPAAPVAVPAEPAVLGTAPAPLASGSLLRESILLKAPTYSRDFTLPRAGFVTVIGNLTSGSGALIEMRPRSDTGGDALVQRLDTSLGGGRAIATYAITPDQVSRGGHFTLVLTHLPGTADSPQLAVEVLQLP